MSPRCKGKVIQNHISILQTSLFFLHLQNENYLYHFRNCIIGTGRSGYLSTTTPYNPFPVTYCRTLFQRVATLVSMVTESETPRPLYS